MMAVMNMTTTYNLRQLRQCLSWRRVWSLLRLCNCENLLRRVLFLDSLMLLAMCSTGSSVCRTILTYFTVFLFIIVSCIQSAAQRKTNSIQLRKVKEEQLLISNFSQYYKNWSKQFVELMEEHEKHYGIKPEVVRTIFGLCSTPKHPWPTPLESSPFLIDRPEFCRARPNVRYLVAVHSHTKSRHRRDLIRSTWASFRRVNDVRFATLFFLGRAENEKAQMEINQESAQYQWVHGWNPFSLIRQKQLSPKRKDANF